MAYIANLIPTTEFTVIHLNQYEYGIDNVITVAIFNGDTPFTIPDGSTIVVTGTRPDGKVFVSSQWVIFEGNEVVFEIQQEMTYVYGEFEFEIVISNGDNRWSTTNLKFNVERSPLNEDLPVSEDEIPACIDVAHYNAMRAKAAVDEAKEVVEYLIGNTIRTVNNIEELLATTEDKVLVLNDDSDFGNGGAVIFYNQASTRSYAGIQRTDGTYVYPMPSEAELPTANAPVKELMAVLKSWIGRDNIIHKPGTVRDLTGLFGPNCAADSDGKFHMDCSDFLSAVLLGITYENSRYVLGGSASNRQKWELITGTMPTSNDPQKSEGGLGASELARWFAEQGRLFPCGSSAEKLSKTLQFGDIIFGTNETSSPRAYWAIEHVMFVLGVAPLDNPRVIVAQCNSDTAGGNEGVVCHIRVLSLYDDSTYFKVFARPNYKTDFQNNNLLVSKGNGKLGIDCTWLPCTEILLDNSATSGYVRGELIASNTFATTFNYIPIKAGSKVVYTGNASTSRGNFYVRLHEYDEHLMPVKRGTTIAYGGSAMAATTIANNTKYVKFAIGWGASTGNKILLSDPDNFDVEITQPDTKLEVVEDQAELAKSTADTVLVLHNDSTFGDGGACLFEATDGVRYYGYQRTSDGKYMVPATDQNEVVTNDPPIDALMSVMKTWVGNENVKHLTVGSTDNGSLFGETIRQVDGKWTMDCSAFTSAVLMGITYNNSRYVRGNNADNITGDYFIGDQFPKSRTSTIRAKGGLAAADTAMWLAEHKRLYSFDEDPDKALAQLQFGDIVFGSNSIYPTYYKNVEHIMIVLGTIPSQGLLIAAESIDLSYDETHYEQSGAHVTVLNLKDSTTGKTNDYYRIWGRPDYSHIGKKKDAIVPKSANSYTYNCFFLEASLVCRGTSDSSSIPAGKLMSDRYSAATPDFYPAIPGSVVSYTGASRCDRGVYLCRVHEFDDTKKLIKSTTIAYASNGNPMTNPVTIGSTTKYLKFTFGLQSNTMSDTNIGIWMSNLDDCEITATLPSE